MTKATVPATANNKAVPILTGTAMDTLRLRSACAWLSTGGASVVGGIVDFDGDDEEPLEGVVDPGKEPTGLNAVLIPAPTLPWDGGVDEEPVEDVVDPGKEPTGLNAVLMSCTHITLGWWGSQSSYNRNVLWSQQHATAGTPYLEERSLLLCYYSQLC